MTARVRIIIVNWNAGPLLARCLASIPADTQTIEAVVVVDNGSTDGSLEQLSHPLVRLVRAGSNLGFGKACNLGAAGTAADYLLFLNPDAELQSGTLETLLGFMEGEEGATVGACGIKLIDEGSRIQRHCARFPSWRTFVGQATGMSNALPGWFPPLLMTDFDHESNRNVDHVIGACYCIRRSLFEELGGFDERFFVYLEDLDLSFRVRQRGWRIHYLADATGFHKGGGTSEQVKAHRLYYALNSRLVYAAKHFARWQTTLVGVATLVIEPLPRLVRAGLRRSAAEARDTLLGFWWLWKGLPRLFKSFRRSDGRASPPV